MSNVKKAGRISLAYDVLVKAVKAIPEEKHTDIPFAVPEDKFKTDVLYHANLHSAVTAGDTNSYEK